jgi:hypothetical protein
VFFFAAILFSFRGFSGLFRFSGFGGFFWLARPLLCTGGEGKRLRGFLGLPKGLETVTAPTGGFSLVVAGRERLHRVRSAQSRIDALSYCGQP